MINIFFPSLCLQCKKPIEKGRLACEVCSHFFDFLEPFDKKIAACFYEVEAAATFVRLQRRPDLTQFHKAAISFLCIQFARLQWPTPDLVTCVKRATLAKGLAKELKLPFAKRRHFVRKKIEARRVLLIHDRLEEVEGVWQEIQEELQAEVYVLALSMMRFRPRIRVRRFERPRQHKAVLL
ncbi:MAG: hypothetical protein H7A36_03195 [Chlamydiales bacterium]|nr:hypothetical protein [Chlamydiales bacterium]